MPGPRNTFAGKAKDGKKAFKEFLSSIKPFRFKLIVSIVFCVGSSILSIFIPKLLGEMTDIAKNTYETGIDWSSLGNRAILIIILFVSSAALNYLQAYLLAVITAKYTRNIREQIIKKISALPIYYFDTHKHGDTISRMTNDVDVITTTMHQEIANISLSLTTLIGVTILMFTISVPLSLITIVIVPLSVFVVGKIAKFAQKYFREQQETIAVLNSKIEEDYSGQTVIKANSYEESAIKDFGETNKKLAIISCKAQIFASLSFPVTHIFTNIGYVAVCIIGGYLVVQGNITIGAMVAFLGYLSRFNRPITEIASTTATIQSLVAACERIFTFLQEKEEEKDPEPAQTIKKVEVNVEFNHINFGYLKDQTVIKNFSVKIKAGQNVAIVGPTGAGKTTLINLLMRFYDPNSGYITIDGVPTREMKRSDVRALFGMVLQDTWLFSGTIEENLRYGNQDATLEDIKRAAKACDIDHVIESLPKGYQTVISEDSDNISAGEKQLLTIARAIVANPPMIILDEATSTVDTRTEQLSQAAFEKITKNRTSFVIAHRLSTIRNSDLILVMKNGNIVEQGTNNELIKQDGFYAELYNSQFKE